MTDTTPTAGRLWKQMTFDQRHRAALAFWRGDNAAQEQILSELRRSDGSWVWFATHHAGRNIGRLDAGIRIARLLTEPARPVIWRARGHLRP